MELHLLERESNRLTDALLVFARYPRLGRVKTRLGSAFSPRESLVLYTAFLLDTLERTALLDVPRHLFLADCTEGEAHTFEASTRRFGPCRVHLQEGDDLGQRMWNAYQSVRSQRVVFIGADSPTLPLSYVSEAFEALHGRPVAIGPVADGGYYLLGLAAPKRELFHDIDWGTQAVLRQTLERLQSQEYVLLPPWRDVDTVEDLPDLRRDLEDPTEGYPRRTSRALRVLAPELWERGS